MPDDASAPCREWLGLEPPDVEVPHLLLGVDAGETDPLAIVRGADRRIAILRGVAPDRAADRDRLLVRVEAARDAMLADAVAARAVVPAGGTKALPVPPPPPPPPVPRPPLPPVPDAGLRPPPVPPSVPTAIASSMIPAPPPVPSAVTAAVADGTDAAIRIARARVTRRGRTDHTAAVGVSAVVLAVAALVVYGAWPYVQNARKVARRPDGGMNSNPRSAATTRQEPNVSPGPRTVPESKPARGSEPVPRVQLASAQQPRSESKPEKRSETRSEPRVEPAPADPEPPQVDVAAVRSLVGTAVTKAFEALRQQDFAAAKRDLAAVAEQALDDQEATDRLQRWQQFLVYAEAYPAYRDEALASAASTSATYDLGGRQIGVVELNAKEFVYRDSRRPGRNLHVPRNAIPPDVETGLVEQWFAKDGRAANHLFLGASALARREPDLAAARRAWQAAAAGGERDGRLLLGILDDPAVRGR